MTGPEDSISTSGREELSTILESYAAMYTPDRRVQNELVRKALLRMRADRQFGGPIYSQKTLFIILHETARESLERPQSISETRYAT